jgi:aspartate racemase
VALLNGTVREEPSPTIGLIGGLGVGATVYYYQAIVDGHRQRGAVPQVLIAHADAGRVLADVQTADVAGLAAYLARFTDRLEAGGASFGAIAAVAPHCCFDELARRSRLPLVSLVTETARTLADRGVKRAALFGTRFVIDSNLYGQLPDVALVRPKPAETELIHDTYLDVVTLGRSTEHHRDTLRRLAHTLIERDGVEAIVLAGTELALVFDHGRTDFPVIDCAAAHVEGIMRRVGQSWDCAR